LRGAEIAGWYHSAEMGCETENKVIMELGGYMFLGLTDPDPDPLVRGMDPDPDADPSISKQN
jgi:hypothetical protein